MEMTLRKACGLGLGMALIVAFSTQLCAQKDSPPHTAAPLVLTGAIPLPNVKGRIDHFAFDPTHNRLFVSALGNNTEEINGIGAQKVVHTISGVPTPQGVAYSPETNKLFVGGDEGKLYVYDGTTLDLITSIDFGDDVDNLRYDAAEKRLYVGYGDEKTGAIGMVDAVTNKRMDDLAKLGAHPESFQLSASSPNIYVNLPDLKQIAVINRNNHFIVRWTVTSESNFPMALDEPNQRLFVATRSPARLPIFDTSSGRLVATLPTVQDSDDLYYASARKRVYVSGGGLHQCVPERRRRSLQASRQSSDRHRGVHRWVFRKRKEGLRPLLSGCSRSRSPRRRSVDLYGAGLEPT
jgi:hypothetical protein